MKFQVQGELDVPKEVAELFTGLTYSGEVMQFQDIEMKVGQTALDRLSVILHLIYATQPLDEVKAYLKETYRQQPLPQQFVQIPTAVQNYQPYVQQSPASQEHVQVTITKPEAPAAVETKPNNSLTFNPQGYTLPEIKVNDSAKKQSIASLSTRMKGRVS